MSYLKSASSNLSSYKIMQTKICIIAPSELSNFFYLGTFGLEFQKVGTQNILFGYIMDRILENYCHIWNHQPQKGQMTNFQEKEKMLKVGTNSALFG